MAYAGIAKGKEEDLVEVTLLGPKLVEVRVGRQWIQLDLDEALQLVNDLREQLRAAYAPKVKTRATAEGVEVSAGVDVRAVLDALTRMPSVVVNFDGVQITRPAIINTRDAVADLIEYLKHARWALTQDATYPADVEVAVNALDRALARVEGAK